MTTIGVHQNMLLVRHAPPEMTPVLGNLIGCRWVAALQSWVMPIGLETGRQALALFPTAEIHPSFSVVQERIAREDQAGAAKECGIEELPPIPLTKTKPWSHQRRAFWFLFHKLGLALPDPTGGAILAMDMGTGKTKVCIDLIQNAPSVRRVLVAAPLAVVATWPEEINTHWAGAPVRVVALAKGSVRKRSEEARRAVEQAEALGQICIIVINHESVWRPDFRKFVLSHRPDLLIVDESHRAKSPGGKLSTFLGNLENKVPLRLALTGTLMPRDHLDLYAQARFVDSSFYGTSNATFKAQYGNFKQIKTKKKDAKGNFIVVSKLVGIRNKDEFERKLDGLAYRVKADDVLDLPPFQFLVRTCELSSSERNAYEEFKRELIVQINDGFVTANNGLVKLLRLQQIVQGYVKDEDGNVQHVGDSKKNLLKDVLMDLDSAEPVVVFCKFHTDLDAVRDVSDQLKRGCLELSGRVNQLQEFKDGGGPILAAQMQSGGVGVNLSRAAYTIYYTPTYDMGAYEQSLRRTRRPTKHRHDKFFYYQLVAENTVDRMVYAALRSKKDLVESVLQGIRGQA